MAEATPETNTRPKGSMFELKTIRVQNPTFALIFLNLGRCHSYVASKVPYQLPCSTVVITTSLASALLSSLLDEDASERHITDDVPGMAFFVVSTISSSKEWLKRVISLLVHVIVQARSCCWRFGDQHSLQQLFSADKLQFRAQ